MKELTKKVTALVLTLASTAFYVMYAFATDIDAPSLTEVRQVSDEGLNLVFGSAGGICIVVAIFQLVQGFMSLSDSKRKGGFGQSKSEMIGHFIGGAAAFIAAILCFWGLGKTLDLFHI